MNSVQDKIERRSEKSRALADRLVGAAEAVIAADGLPALRARALASAVGCSVGAIYGVYEDLDAIILEVNALTLDAFVADMGRDARGAGPEDQLVQMAEAYLDYAARNRHRWAALFQHRLPPGRTITESYANRQEAAFRQIEAPLAALHPTLPEIGLAARTLFSAVHGVVALGLDERITVLKLPVLRAQLGQIVRAAVRGLVLRS